jgi:hypothetical protein
MRQEMNQRVADQHADRKRQQRRNHALPMIGVVTNQRRVRSAKPPR